MFLIRYKRAEDAKMALEQMEGFELAGRTVRPLVVLKSYFMTHPLASFV